MFGEATWKLLNDKKGNREEIISLFLSFSLSVVPESRNVISYDGIMNELLMGEENRFKWEE